MAAYTIEDIELIRRKSGISYQEAVALLDYHNGNVARALVDLERNGRIREGAAEGAVRQGHGHADSKGEPIRKSAILELLHKCYRARLKVHRQDTAILNISAIFAVIALLISPHLLILGVILSILLGYRFTLDKHDHAFDGENLERTVRHAAENAKNSVSDFARSFQSGEEKADKADKADTSDADRSYYSARRPEPTYRPSYPTMNVPVQVESQDGSVTIESDSEGYSSATVE